MNLSFTRFFKYSPNLIGVTCTVADGCAIVGNAVIYTVILVSAVQQKDFATTVLKLKDN